MPYIDEIKSSIAELKKMVSGLREDKATPTLPEQLAALPKYSLRNIDDRFDDLDLVERPDGEYFRVEDVMAVVNKTEATTTAAIPQQMVGFQPAIVGRTFGIEWKKWKATPARERKDNKST